MIRKAEHMADTEKVQEKIEKKKKFDKEYATQYTPEMKFLLEKGIRYTFVKEINGVTTYKYEKTPVLFQALVEFYSMTTS